MLNNYYPLLKMNPKTFTVSELLMLVTKCIIMKTELCKTCNMKGSYFNVIKLKECHVVKVII